MKAVNVTLRPVDIDRLEYLKQYLTLMGEAVGRPTASAAVREALRIAHEQVQREYAIGQDETPADLR